MVMMVAVVMMYVAGRPFFLPFIHFMHMLL
jgi:hypothetical protein